MRGKNLFFFTLGAGCVAAGLWGLSVGALTNFTAGTPIRASEVNDNFTVLRTAIEALEQPAGVSRLAIGGTIGDGKVLKAQGGNLVWGDDNAGGVNFGTSLTGSNSANPGFRISNMATAGTGIQGEVSTTGSGVLGLAGLAGAGVEGRVPGGGGIGVLGRNSGIGYGVKGINTAAGIAVEGEAIGPGAGVSALASNPSATALLINGSIGVRGNSPAFVHTATVANINASRTTIDHPMTNGDPNAMLTVTHVSSGADPFINSPIGVSYDSTAGRWRIFRADAGAMPDGAKFNVLVIKQL